MLPFGCMFAVPAIFLIGKILLLVLIDMQDPSEGELQIFLYRLLLGGWVKLLSQTSA